MQRNLFIYFALNWLNVLNPSVVGYVGNFFSHFADEKTEVPGVKQLLSGHMANKDLEFATLILPTTAQSAPLPPTHTHYSGART